jgi:hypothetical protein
MKKSSSSSKTKSKASKRRQSPETGRVRCLVPHCGRSRRDNGDGVSVLGYGWLAFDRWLCAVHYPMVPVSLRFLHQTAKRQLRQTREPKDAMIAQDIWSRCCAAAIEAAAGIGSLGRDRTGS